MTNVSEKASAIDGRTVKKKRSRSTNPGLLLVNTSIITKTSNTSAPMPILFSIYLLHSSIGRKDGVFTATVYCFGRNMVSAASS